MAKDFNINVINLDEVRQYLEDLPEDIFDDAKMVFRKAVIAADRQVKGRFGSKINSRSGTLRRSLGFSVTGTKLADLKASTFGRSSVGGNPVPYTLAQEFPTIIKAKDKYRRVPGGPYLNIPLSANQTAAGVMRMNARQVFEQGGFIAQSKAKNWIVFLGTGQPMFVLKKKVELKARLGMREAAADQIPTILSSLQNLIGED